MAKEYEIRTTAEFWTDYEKLSKSEQERIDKVKEQLKTNPYVGKPLGYKFFREKRVDGKRLYYLVYEDVIVVLLVTLSDKKAQQATIDAIKRAFEIYRKDVYEKFRK